MMRQPIRIRVHLGSGEEGERRKAALQKIAADAGFIRSGEGNISGWLSSLADESINRPAEASYRQKEGEMSENLRHFDTFEAAQKFFEENAPKEAYYVNVRFMSEKAVEKLSDKKWEKSHFVRHGEKVVIKWPRWTGPHGQNGPLPSYGTYYVLVETS